MKTHTQNAGITSRYFDIEHVTCEGHRIKYELERVERIVLCDPDNQHIDNVIYPPCTATWGNGNRVVYAGRKHVTNLDAYRSK